MLKSDRITYNLFYNNFNMKNKKIAIFAIWYLLGWLVASLYVTKNGKTLQEDLKKVELSKEDELKVLFTHFCDTHTNFLQDLKTRVLTDSTKKYINDKKQDLINVVEEYKKHWDELVVELKEKWKEYLNEAKSKLEQLYSDKKDQIDELKEQAPDKIEEIKNSLESKFNDWQDKIKKMHK